MNTALVRVAAAALLAPLVGSCGLAPLETLIAGEREVAGDLVEELAPLPARPLVVVHDGPFLAADRIAHAAAPWMYELVDIRASGLSFDLCLAKAMEQMQAPPSVVLAPDVATAGVAVTLDHRGSFREFLDLLAEASGFAWEERAQALHWMAEVTKTLEIHRVPGELSMSMRTASGEEDQVVQAGGSGSSSGVRASPESSGSIDLRIGGGFWESLEAMLGRILGFDHPPIIDRSTGQVLVRGPARLVRAAEGYVDALNSWLARQVLLEIQVVTVTFSDDRSTGIDWRLVRTASGANPTGGSNFADLSARALGSTPASVGIRLADELAGTQIILRALAEQGETSVRNTPRVVALNGQAAQMQVLNDRAYLASVDVTTRENAALATQVQLQPGSLSTGISLTILPKIVGDKVFLHANVQVSELVSLDSSGGDNSIQLPTVDRTQFFQSARLSSGETLALGGLTARRGATGQQSIARFAWLGAKSRRFRRTETVLLITPTLLDRPATDESLL